MLGAIYIGLSGMNAYSQGLQTISNNVANLNSPGFKASSVTFSDVFNVGGLGSSYTGNGSRPDGQGVRFGSPTINFKEGDLRQSGGDLDLAIKGGGFLVLKDGDKTVYTRTGQFVPNEAGFITLLGTRYQLGVLNADRQAVPLNVDASRTSAPKATTTITLSGNVSSTGTDASVSDIAVYDSRGGRQVWQVRLTPAGATAPNEWNVVVTNQSGATVGASTLRFIGSVVDPSTSRLTIAATPDGADPLSVTLDFSSGVTSFSSGTTSTLRTASVDGYGAGTLTRMGVNDAGRIELTYSNGRTEDMGAVALADFRNPQQLERIGNGLFQNRGPEGRLLASGVEGMGTLVSKQLEASNVDLSQQFGDLILIQRGFQASSQVVSVTNDMIQQLFGMRGQG